VKKHEKTVKIFESLNCFGTNGKLPPGKSPPSQRTKSGRKPETTLFKKKRKTRESVLRKKQHHN
jgi:hypothetical protein